MAELLTESQKHCSAVLSSQFWGDFQSYCLNLVKKTLQDRPITYTELSHVRESLNLFSSTSKTKVRHLHFIICLLKLEANFQKLLKKGSEK